MPLLPGESFMTCNTSIFLVTMVRWEYPVLKSCHGPEHVCSEYNEWGYVTTMHQVSYKKGSITRDVKRDDRTRYTTTNTGCYFRSNHRTTFGDAGLL